MAVRVGRRPTSGFYGLVVQNGPWDGPMGRGSYEPASRKEIIHPYVVKSGRTPALSVVASRIVKDEPVLISNSGYDRNNYLGKRYGYGKYVPMVNVEVPPMVSVGTDPDYNLPSMPTNVDTETSMASAPFDEEVLNDFLSELPQVLDVETPTFGELVASPKWGERVVNGVINNSPAAVTLLGNVLREYMQTVPITRELVGLGTEGVITYFTPPSLRPTIRQFFSNFRRGGMDLIRSGQYGFDEASIASLRALYDQLDATLLGPTQTSDLNYNPTRIDLVGYDDPIPYLDQMLIQNDNTVTRPPLALMTNVYGIVMTIMQIIASLAPQGRRAILGRDNTRLALPRTRFTRSGREF